MGVAGTGLGVSSGWLPVVGDVGPLVCGSVPAADCDGGGCSPSLGGSASLMGENHGGDPVICYILCKKLMDYHTYLREGKLG